MDQRSDRPPCRKVWYALVAEILSERGKPASPPEPLASLSQATIRKRSPSPWDWSNRTDSVPSIRLSLDFWQQ